MGAISELLSQTAPSGTWGEILPQGIALAQAVHDAQVTAIAAISQQITALQAQIALLQQQATVAAKIRDDAQQAVASMQETLTLLQNS